MSTEKCANPFQKKKCGNTDIVVYLTGDEIPICQKCWKEIADTDWEWDE